MEYLVIADLDVMIVRAEHWVNTRWLDDEGYTKFYSFIRECEEMQRDLLQPQT